MTRQVESKQRRLFQSRSAGALVSFILFAGSALGAEDKTQSASAEGTKPQLKQLVLQIRVQPSQVVFSNSSEYQRILVFGKTKELGEVDLSQEAVLTPTSDCVKWDSKGYLFPVRDCETKVQVAAGGQKAEVAVTVRGLRQPRSVSFVRDVEPILNKVGCTQGTCHGAAKGKNGFKLSLRGYDPQFDYDHLVRDLSGRRFNRADPARSLMLLKPTGQVAHGGGQRFEVDSPYYQTILQWISEGVPFGDPKAGAVKQVEVAPLDILMPKPGLSQGLKVVAHYTDGSSRDVTREAVYSSTVPGVADVTQDGWVTTGRKGETSIVVRYEGNYVLVNTTVLPDKQGFRWVQLPQYNYIDKYIDAKLQRVRVLPSEMCSDAEFLRRVSLDLIGLPPTPEEVRAFLNDKSPRQLKRGRKVEELMARPQFVDHWSLKWGDLLKANRKYLGEKGLWRYRDWIRQSVAENKRYDQFVYEILTARGSTYDNPAANYFLVSDSPNTQMEATTQLFLGVRFVCAHCHDHPFEQWTQKQYWELSGFFARVGIRDGARNLEKVVYDKDEGDVTYPKNGRVASPEFPFLVPAHFSKETGVLSAESGRRERVARWLTSKNNPYFAKAISNRIWSYFFGRGIIEPVDDIRLTNPPSNSELLNALTRDLIDHNFDLRYLMRTIVKSRTYQLSTRTNDWNVDDEANFSHSAPRRLTAEELMDGIRIATGSAITFKEVPKDFLAEELPDSKVGMGGFLDLFGRPQREAPCECERRSEVSLKQALSLINGSVVSDAIADPNGRISKLILDGVPDHKLVEDVYLAALNRPPDEAEYKNAMTYLAASNNRAEKAQDLMWALLNSYAFLFNR
jgi:hypothetical protein